MTQNQPWRNDWSWLKSHRRWVILGSDTEVGKTHLACELIGQLRQRFSAVAAFKPAASGVDIDNDAVRLAAASNYLQSLDAICPYRFTVPIAPVLAAEQQGVTIERHVLASAIEEVFRAPACVVETAGGILSPLDWQTSNLCWAAELVADRDCRLVLVVPNRLGAVNATLQAWQTIVAQDVPLDAIVLNEFARWGNDERRWDENVDMLQRVMSHFVRSHRSPPPIYRYRSNDR